MQPYQVLKTKRFYGIIAAGIVCAVIFCIIFSFQCIVLKIKPVPISYILPSLVGFISGLLIQYFKAKWEREAINKEKERLNTIREITGAICHEMNQPLQAILGNLEMLLEDFSKENPTYTVLIKIQKQAERMAKITKKLNSINKYRTKKYLSGKIIDIDESSS